MPSLVLFISFLHARKLASSTFKSYLSEISYVQKLKGLRDPTQAFLINKLLTALSRQGSCDIRLPISRPVLHELVGSLGHNASSAFQRTFFFCCVSTRILRLLSHRTASTQEREFGQNTNTHDTNNNLKVQPQYHKPSIRYLDRGKAFMAILPHSGSVQLL